MATQLNALYRTTASTLGAMLLKARQVYLAVIRTSLTDGAVAWHRPNTCLNNSAQKLQQQNVGPRIVPRAFKRCSIAQLHIEAYVPSLHLWLNGEVALFHARVEKSGIRSHIMEACYKIQLAIHLADRPSN